MKHKIFISLIAFCGTYFLPEIIPFISNIGYYNHVVSLIVFFLLISYLLKPHKKPVCFSWILSAVYCFCLLAGSKISTTGSLPLKSLSFYLSFIMYTYIGAVLIEDFYGWMQQRTTSGKHENYSIFNKPWGIWFAIFFCWIPIWLALYPGVFAYDAENAFNQVLTGEYTAHHPILHTLILGGIVNGIGNITGKYNYGIVVYSLFQMAVVAGIFTNVVLFLRREGATSKIMVGTLVWYSVFPVVSITAGCSTKDVLFTAVSISLLIKIYYFIKNRQTQVTYKDVVVLSTLCFLFMVLRTTSFYLFIIIGIALLLFMERCKRKKLILSLGLAVTFYILYTGPFYTWLEVTPADSRVAFSVPNQQFARVYNKGQLTYEEKNVLTEYLSEDSLDNRWVTRFSDSLNGGFNIEKFKESPQNYIRLYIQLGLKYPVVYTSAFLELNIPYWYPGYMIDGYTQYYQKYHIEGYSSYKNSSYFGPYTEPPGKRESKIPALETVINNLTYEYIQSQIPVVSMAFSPAVYFWILLFAIYVTVRKKMKCECFILAIMLFIIAACFIGPIALLRYCLILFYGFPLVAYWTISNDDTDKNSIRGEKIEENKNNKKECTHKGLLCTDACEISYE